MWALTNNTAYAAERTWTRDKDGQHHWIVVIKATFDFTPEGKLSLADEQIPPVHEPEYYGEPGRSSLRWEADLIGLKPATDVIVNAHAHAPQGRPTREVTATLRIDKLRKDLLIRGDSHYGIGVSGLTPSSPAPFVSRPIRYEQAFGGTDEIDAEPSHHCHDPRNPIGVGIGARFEHLIGRPAPSVYYPHGNPATIGPAGFGAIASYWSPRRELGGTYDARWSATKQPLLPDDYDDTQRMCTPADQRAASPLRGGEIIDLINLTPTGALRIELPKICVLCKTKIAGRSHRDDQRARLVSVVLEPELGKLTMAWQTSLHVAGPDIDYLDETVVREKAWLR